MGDVVLMECPICKGKVASSAKVCPHCGYDVASFVEEDNKRKEREALSKHWLEIYNSMVADKSAFDGANYVKVMYAMAAANFPVEKIKEFDDELFEKRGKYDGWPIGCIMGYKSDYYREKSDMNFKLLFLNNGEVDYQYSDMVENDTFICEMVNVKASGEEYKILYSKELYEFSGYWEFNKKQYEQNINIKRKMRGYKAEDFDLVNGERAFGLFSPSTIKLFVYHGGGTTRAIVNSAIDYINASSAMVGSGGIKGVKCPVCGRESVRKISVASRSVSAGLFGLGSSKIGKTMECLSCKYKF